MLSIGSIPSLYVPPSTPDERKKIIVKFQQYIAELISSNSKSTISSEAIKNIRSSDAQCWLLDNRNKIRDRIDVVTAITLLDFYGDAHLFKIYAVQSPGLAAYALLSRNSEKKGTLDEQVLNAIAEAVLEKGHLFGLEIESMAKMVYTCAGAVCQVLLKARVTENIPAGHPIGNALAKFCPKVKRNSLDQQSVNKLDQLKAENNLRGEVARLIELY
jgi:predicted Zn-dependent protease